MTAPFALDFHDSEVLAIEPTGDALRVRLSAAHVRRGEDGARGYLGSVEIAARGAAWPGELAPGFGRLVVGRLRCDGLDVAPTIPLRLAGALSLELRFADGARLEITAAAIAIDAAADAPFREDFSC